MKTSIQRRLLGTSTGVLVVFLGLTGWVLDRSFSTSVVAGAEEQLRLVIYSLMGAVVENDARLTVAQGLSEPRLNQPDSGLYASVRSDIGEQLWVSPSAAMTDVTFPVEDLQPGAFVFRQVGGEMPRFLLSYMVIWEDAEPEQVVFTAITDQSPFRAAIAQFRRSLGVGFGIAMGLFVVAQLLALRFGLLPLRTMAAEVRELESGERERLSKSYPVELQGLAGNLDRFVAHEQRSRSRYRNALEDLAHSLKTPLAVVRNSLLEEQPDKQLLRDQLDRMETTVTHQLSKASASGPVVVGRPVELAGLAARIVRALQTAYVEREIEVRMAEPAPITVRGDERDFMELVGNLLENAFKYCAGIVSVQVSAAATEGFTARVLVEDNGPGIPPDLRAEVLRRGRRLDALQAGQGIGLAMVAELVGLYQGELRIGASELGGARIEVLLP